SLHVLAHFHIALTGTYRRAGRRRRLFSIGGARTVLEIVTRGCIVRIDDGVQGCRRGRDVGAGLFADTRADGDFPVQNVDDRGSVVGYIDPAARLIHCRTARSVVGSIELLDIFTRRIEYIRYFMSRLCDVERAIGIVGGNAEVATTERSGRRVRSAPGREIVSGCVEFIHQDGTRVGNINMPVEIVHGYTSRVGRAEPARHGSQRDRTQVRATGTEDVYDSVVCVDHIDVTGGLIDRDPTWRVEAPGRSRARARRVALAGRRCRAARYLAEIGAARIEYVDHVVGGVEDIHIAGPVVRRDSDGASTKRARRSSGTVQARYLRAARIKDVHHA